jgi:hypothetical protein
MTNPFLLPPGGKPDPQPPAPTPAAEPETPVGDPARYIAVPPSVESATHRLARPDPDPSPEPKPVIEPVEIPVEIPTEIPTEIPEETQLAPRVAAVTAWSLVLPDGSRTPLTGPLLFGRDPAAIPGAPGAGLVRLVDPGKTVSKTHAVLEPVEGGVRVRDLHSTNGVAITAFGVRTVLAPAGEGVAPTGSTIELGSFAIVVEARI